MRARNSIIQFLQHLSSSDEVLGGFYILYWMYTKININFALITKNINAIILYYKKYFKDFSHVKSHDV